MKAAEPLLLSARAAWKPQDLRTPWEWCEDHVIVDNTSPFPGKWRSATSPWVREVMEVAADRRVTFIAVRCSAQSSKTQTVLNLLAYCIAEDPGPAMYVMANQPDAEDFVRDRFAPTIRNCKPAWDLRLRDTKASFTFSTMPLYFVGAGSLGKLQGKPMKRLFLDEVRNWIKGALPTVMKRVRAFSQLGSQIFLISTPDMENDEVDSAFKQGDQRTFHFPCPACGQIQQLRFAQLKAVHPESGAVCKWKEVPGALENGQWNFDKLSPWLRFVCEKCNHPIADTPAERKAICRNGHFIRMNPNAPAHHVSFTWNALLPWWVPWRSIVEELIQARDAARAGDTSKMKTFVTETLGEPWKDELGIIEDYGFLEARKGQYEYGEVWPESKRRFITADRGEKGGEHYWFVVREYGPESASRLVTYGQARTLAELEQRRIDYGVKPGDAALDTGYQTQDCYRFCLANNWKAFKGEYRDYYLVQRKDPRNPSKLITVRQIWNKSIAVVYNTQTKAKVGTIPLWLFADGPLQDLLAEYLQGLIGNWTIPRQVEKLYLQQIAAERREQKTDAKGVVTSFWKRYGDQHLRDCEKMNKLCAIITLTIAEPIALPAAKPAPTP